MNQMLAKIDPAVYQIADASEMNSPGLIVYKDLLLGNLSEMIRIAGGPENLRPHCKTHKMPAVIDLLQDLGVTKHKCATLAEAEMLCAAGVRDVVLAYQMVGPNVPRLMQLMEIYPDVRLAVLVDHPEPLEQLSVAADAKKLSVDVLLDIDSGMNRTGVLASEAAFHLYEMICSMPGIKPAGLHWYDGHHRQSDLEERRAAILQALVPMTTLRDQLLLQGLPVPKVLVAGTGSFPVLAELGEPNLELTPGTTTLYDIGYREHFPDIPLQPALGVLTRVVSCNRAGHLTLDCGHKSISPDQPAGQRAFFPELPEAVELGHNEEHLVIQTDRAEHYSPGDHLVALPRHVCPTSALHQSAYVMEGGRLVEQWAVVARDRVITV